MTVGDASIAWRLVDAEQSPVESMRRVERRYLVHDPAELIALLSARGALTSYRVSTTYLKPPVVASVGKPPKIRLRCYDDEPHLWLEVKRRSRRRVVFKERRTVAEVPPGLEVIGEVRYRRVAFDQPNLRVTLDSELTVVVDGVEGVRFAGVVVEVKSNRPLPKWLKQALPEESKRWSKSRWLREQLAVEVTPAQGPRLE